MTIEVKEAAPSGDDALLEQDALGLAELVANGEVSARELLEAAIVRAEALDPRFNFMAQRHYDFARAAIDAGLPQGPFTGVPWLLKDLEAYIAGEVTGQGSRYYRDYRPAETSELVRRYQQAGLVIFGKTTTPEFGLTPSTESLATGATRNPWHPDHIAGGSSGGAAVAVATGVVPAAHASDGGGSIRIPASCCGLFGLKPSRGRVPMGPYRTEGWGGLSTQHVVSRSVRDSAALLDATHGPETGSRYCAPTPARPFLAEVRRDPGRLRIALQLAAPAGTPVDPECAAAAQAAARLCERLGHHVEEAALPIDVEALGWATGAVVPPSVAAQLIERERETGIAPGADTLEPMTLSIYRAGLNAGAADFARGNGIFQAAAIAMARFMERFDVILSPTLASPPLKLGRITLAGEDFEHYARTVYEFIPFTALMNQTGQPSMSIPLAMSKAGLPIGLMFSGRYGEEGLLLRLAAQLEIAAPWAGRRPSL